MVLLLYIIHDSRDRWLTLVHHHQSEDDDLSKVQVKLKYYIFHIPCSCEETCPRPSWPCPDHPVTNLLRINLIFNLFFSIPHRQKFILYAKYIGFSSSQNIVWALWSVLDIQSGAPRTLFAMVFVVRICIFYDGVPESGEKVCSPIYLERLALITGLSNTLMLTIIQ